MTKHLGRIHLSACLIKQLMSLPGDLTILRFGQGNDHAQEPTVTLVVEHDSLPLVDDGSPIPNVAPKIYNGTEGPEFYGWE